MSLPAQIFAFILGDWWEDEMKLGEMNPFLIDSLCRQSYRTRSIFRLLRCPGIMLLGKKQKIISVKNKDVLLGMF